MWFAYAVHDSLDQNPPSTRRNHPAPPQPRMSEPRCRTFLALLPNIRHNRLKALGEHLSRCVKRLQGVPPPDLSAAPPKRGGVAAARARAAAKREARERQAQQRQMGAAATAGKTEEEEEEDRRRARILDGGWKEGPFFQDLGDDVVGVLAGCAVSTFRR